MAYVPPTPSVSPVHIDDLKEELNRQILCVVDKLSTWYHFDSHQARTFLGKMDDEHAMAINALFTGATTTDDFRDVDMLQTPIGDDTYDVDMLQTPIGYDTYDVDMFHVQGF